MAEKCTSRLDMNHGFVVNIRRNQIDRDNYDKAQKLEKPKKPFTSKSNERTKKPDAKLYTPPYRGGINTNKSNKTGKTPIFILTLEEDNGLTFDLPIYEDSDLHKVSEEFAKERGICSPLIPVLRLKLEESYEKYKKKV